jgi:hypothetical protein
MMEKTQQAGRRQCLDDLAGDDDSTAGCGVIGRGEEENLGIRVCAVTPTT